MQAICYFYTCILHAYILYFLTAKANISTCLSSFSLGYWFLCLFILYPELFSHLNTFYSHATFSFRFWYYAAPPIKSVIKITSRTTVTCKQSCLMWVIFLGHLKTNSLIFSQFWMVLLQSFFMLHTPSCCGEQRKRRCRFSNGGVHTILFSQTVL